jgi:YHS domain-containing protein
MHGARAVGDRDRLEEDAMAIDPVCKMIVDERSAAAVSQYKGKTYYFCAPGCKAAFEEDPERFVTPKKRKGLFARLLGNGKS